MTDHHDFDKNYLENGKGFKSWFFTVDHKRLGVMYLWAIGIFFVLAAIASFLIRFEHLSPGQTIISAQTYNVLFTLHGAVMVFLFIVPLRMPSSFFLKRLFLYSAAIMNRLR